MTAAKPAIVIAGTRSGVGKTTVTLSLLALLAHKGITVQPYKIGPDYIDPFFHELISGTGSINLDPYLMRRNAIKNVFATSMQAVEAGIIEGVMGLYDGHRRVRGTSTASIAKILDVPVLLVLDCSKVGQSIAAEAIGYTGIIAAIPDGGLNFAGLILNNVASQSHLEILVNSLKPLKIPLAGVFMKGDAVSIGEVHLGLDRRGADKKILADKLTVLALRSFNIGVLAKILMVDSHRISGSSGIDRHQSLTGEPKTTDLWHRQKAVKKDLRVTNTLSNGDVHTRKKTNAAQSWHVDDGKRESDRPRSQKSGQSKLKMAVAYDDAFFFYYTYNMKLFQESGFAIETFSPLSDDKLPSDIDLLFLGGGYPEMYAQTLEKNTKMLKEIKKYVTGGGHIYAECGGLIYLSRSIKTDKKKHKLSGVLPFKIVMSDKRTNLGYADAIAANDSFLLKKGEKIKGHRFHWSRIENISGLASNGVVKTGSSEFVPAYEITDRQGNGFDGAVTDRLIASYLHLNFASYPELVKRSYKTIKDRKQGSS